MKKISMTSKRLSQPSHTNATTEEATGEENEHPCICLRPTHFVFCSKCGAVFKGRCRKKCLKHPRTTYLMDNDICVACKRSDSLLEIH